ncbi:hypothetical protein Sste5346_006517 [Sporothrix stenoceras]|uniref:Heterokaryon incompatibility domain-containing protein n=1 Tax=Sporothrix stenoceras TaxID=5173 RepID=A0ABR3YZF6_9PEZI
MSTATTGSAPPRVDNTLPYHGKAVDNNSLRILSIEPGKNDEPIVCKLVEVPFRDKPKFNALSYTWGDSTPSDPKITLNGFPFRVRQNLYDALIFLRQQSASAPQRFWIDAICINQDDVDERNRQVRIMDQIYFRASSVIIWLGQSYAQIEALESDEFIQQKKVFAQVQVDPYWERVWILQEMTKAWSLTVFYGTQSYTWDKFLDQLRGYTDDGGTDQSKTNPLILHQTLRGKEQRGSHKLIDLLKNHIEAKCTDRHDKIYGLLGMATDGAGFPIDYAKSMHELWTDTMVFLNEKKLLSVLDSFVYIGGLVKHLLQVEGDQLQTAATASTKQAGNTYPEQLDTSHLIDVMPEKRHVLDRLSRSPVLHPRAYYMHATVLGSVLRVGPTTECIVGEPDVLSTWKSAIGDLYDPEELDDAHWESDNLLRTLLDTDDDMLANSCKSLPSTVIFPPETFPVNARNAVGIEVEPAGQAEASSSTPVDPKLYYLKALSGITRNKMGVAAGLVKPGDIICEYSKRTLIVRVFHEGPLAGKAAVVGTALTTEEICLNNSHDYTPNTGRIIDRYADIYIGIEALFALSEWKGELKQDSDDDY